MILTGTELPWLVGLKAAHFVQDLHGHGRLHVEPNLLVQPICALHPHHLQLVGPAFVPAEHVSKRPGVLTLSGGDV